MNTEPNAFTVKGFLASHGICRNLFYNEVNAGRLRIVKCGRKTLVRKTDADHWLENLPEGKTSPKPGE